MSYEEIDFILEHIDPRNLFNIGCNYLAGTNGAPRNKELALCCLNRAANQGHVGAAMRLGDLYSNDWANYKDLEQAVRYYQLAANLGSCEGESKVREFYPLAKIIERVEQGSAEALYELGMRYENDVRDIRDVEMAIKYYTLASDKGHKEAQYRLGEIYESAKGRILDLEKSVHYFELAADHGHIEAMKRVSEMYRNGRRVPLNFEKAKHYCDLAPKLSEDDNFANPSAAALYKHGEELSKLGPNNAAGSIVEYERAAQRGHLKAQIKVAPKLYAIGFSGASAFYLWMAANQGDVASQMALADLYQEGRCIDPNLDEAKKYYLLAAAQGNVNAQLKLAEIFEGEDNMTQAKRYLKLAAAYGNAGAQQKLSEILDEKRASRKAKPAASQEVTKKDDKQE